MIHLIRLGTLLVGLTAGAAIPERSCDVIMTGSATVTDALPLRELNLTSISREFLRTHASHGRLIAGLEHVYALLTPELMGQLGPAFRLLPIPKPETRELVQNNEFLRDHRDKIDDTVVANYIMFSLLLESGELPPYELGLASLLLKGFDRTPFAQRVKEAIPASGADEIEARLRRLLERSPSLYRPALVVMLTLPESRQILLSFWNDIVKSRPLTAENLDTMIQRLHKRTIGPAEMQVYTFAVRAFTLALTSYGTKVGRTQDAFDTHHIVRAGYLGLAENYLYKNDLPPSLVTPALDLLDAFYFDAKVPTEPDQLYQRMVEATKRLLLPAKAAYAGRCTEAERARRAEAIHPTVTPTEFRLVDMFEAKTACPRAPRERHDVDPTPAPLVTAPPDPADAIPPERALRSLSLYTGGPGTLLEVGREYEFVFGRDDLKVAQRVTFDEKAADWFANRPEDARVFLLAFERGRTRNVGQNGLKRLFRDVRHLLPTEVYSIKTAGSYRGVVTLRDGLWTVRTVVHHNLLDHALENL